MKLIVTFRKIQGTSALKEHITKRTEKFEKFVSYPIEVHVAMSLEKDFHCAEITCHAEHHEMVAIAKTNDLYESIDLAAHKLETQLKKQREKRKGHTAAHALGRTRAAKLASDILADLPHQGKRRPRRVPSI